ncbi:Late transcription factor VLTF-4 (1), partial [Monkeypox virus]
LSDLKVATDNIVKDLK